jgi:hypothetical protein
VPYRPDGQPCLVRCFPQGGPLQPVTRDDAEYCFNDVLAPGFGIYDFRHSFYLARMCSFERSGMPCCSFPYCPASGTRRRQRVFVG